MRLVHVDLVDASGTEVGFDNNASSRVYCDRIGVFVKINKLTTMYPWHRVLAVEYED